MPSALQFPIQLRFGDEDSNGHVNNVRYLQYLEDARVQLTRRPLGEAAGIDADPGQTFQDLVGPDHFMLVARHTLDYVAPLFYRPEPIYVNIRIAGIGGSSFDLAYTVAEQDDSRVYVRATSRLVKVSRDTGRAARLSDAQRHVIRQWTAGPGPACAEPASSDSAAGLPAGGRSLENA